jgi:hypothetical protein
MRWSAAILIVLLLLLGLKSIGPSGSPVIVETAELSRGTFGRALPGAPLSVKVEPPVLSPPAITASVVGSAASRANPVTAAAAFEIARTNPVLALTLAAELDPGEERDEVRRHSAAQWAAFDPKSAADWAINLEEGPLRARILAETAMAWSERDPLAAVRFAMDQLDPGRAQDDAIIGIVQRWSQIEPEKARAWVSTFEAGPLKEIATENLLVMSAP